MSKQAPLHRPSTQPPASTPPKVALSADERAALDSLAAAWNQWLQIKRRAPQDDLEFQGAIHRAQGLIALRVARRSDPDVWRQP